MTTLLAGEISRWVDCVRSGDQDSTTCLWDSCFGQLVGVAERRLAQHRYGADAEDVALSAFNSVCHGLTQGRFQALRHRDELWALLVTVVERKARAHDRRLTRLKRNGGHTAVQAPMDLVAVDSRSSDAMAFARLVMLEVLEDLPEESLRLVAKWKVAGYLEKEMAERLGCSIPTVKRKLALIRDCLKKHLR